MAQALEAGADGAIAALANLAPAECVGILRATRAGDSTQASVLQQRIAALGEAVTTRYGVPGLKAALQMQGYDHGSPRAPLPPLADSEKPALRRLLEAAQLLPGTVRA